jgi:hypothetical protein
MGLRLVNLVTLTGLRLKSTLITLVIIDRGAKLRRQREKWV